MRNDSECGEDKTDYLVNPDFYFRDRVDDQLEFSTCVKEAARILVGASSHPFRFHQAC